MICLEISLNERLMWRMGVENATMLSPTISSFVGAEDPAGLHVSGMCDLPSERSAHVYWGEPISLHSGDTVHIVLVESTCPTPPSEVKATDSPEYLEEQRQFEELDRAYVPSDTPVIRRWPAVAFRCSVNGQHQATATLASNEEHILCSLLWDQWHPGQCRVFVRSFSGSTKRGDKRQTEWLRANLSLNEFLEVQVRGA